MKTYKTIQVPAKEQSVLDGTFCDLCGCSLDSKYYEVDDVEIEYRKGASYPEGGGGTSVTVDMCGNCFKTELIPWLKGRGADPVAKEWSY
jgi:hypothetical protein